MPGMTALPGVIVIGMPALTLLLEAPAEIVLHLRVLGITRISRSTHNVADVVTCNHTQNHYSCSRLATSLPAAIRSKRHKKMLIVPRG